MSDGAAVDGWSALGRWLLRPLVADAPTLEGPALATQRLLLRPPRRGDFEAWARLRRASEPHLRPWEPRWSSDHLTAGGFRRRVSWARAEIVSGRGAPLLVLEATPERETLIGGVTLEHVRRGAAQSAALGYWLGEPYVGRGYMTEALGAVIEHAFGPLDLSRLEAACLAHNFRSRRVLERCGFRLEGLARDYLQIDGRWRDHLVYELRRADRRSR